MIQLKENIGDLARDPPKHRKFAMEISARIVFDRPPREENIIVSVSISEATRLQQFGAGIAQDCVPAAGIEPTSPPKCFQVERQDWMETPCPLDHAGSVQPARVSRF